MEEELSGGTGTHNNCDGTYGGGTGTRAEDGSTHGGGTGTQTEDDSTHGGGTGTQTGKNAGDARQDFAAVIDRWEQLPDRDWSQYPPLALAWIGDTVYDLIVRSVLLKRGLTHPDRLHRKASRIVSARAQAALMCRIREDLTEEEKAVCRRGRNAKSGHKAKNADVTEYREATAFECLTGYLYLTGQYERILALVTDALREIELSSSAPADTPPRTPL